MCVTMHHYICMNVQYTMRIEQFKVDMFTHTPPHTHLSIYPSVYLCIYNVPTSQLPDPKTEHKSFSCTDKQKSVLFGF